MHFSAPENPFTDFSLAFAKCFCSLAWLFQCKQTNLTGIRKCIKICSSGIYHLLVSMFRTHTHTRRERETHTHLYVAFMAYCNCSVDFSTTEAAEAVLPWQRFEIFYFCDIFGNLFPQQSVSQSVRESVTSSIWQSVVCLFGLRVGHKLLWCLAMPQTNLDRLFVGNACRFRCSCLCCMQLPTPLQPVTTLCAALGVRALGDRAINTSVFKFNERLSPLQIKRCGRRRRPELGKYPACAGKSKSQTACLSILCCWSLLPHDGHIKWYDCVCELLFYLPWLKYNESVATTPPFPLLLPFYFRLNLPLKCGAFSHFISLPLPPPLPLCIVSTFPLWLSSNISTYSRYSCTLSIRQMCHSCCWKGNGQLQTCNICHIQNQSSLNGNGNAGQSGGHTHM